MANNFTYEPCSLAPASQNEIVSSIQILMLARPLFVIIFVICRARTVLCCTVLYVATLHRSLTMCYSCRHSSFSKPKTDDLNLDDYDLNLDELFAEYFISETDELAAIQSPENSFCLAIGEPDELAAIQSPGNSFCHAIGDEKGVFPSDDPQYQLLYSELAQATNQVVTATTGIQSSQRREGAVKKRKKRGTRLLTKHSRTHFVPPIQLAELAVAGRMPRPHNLYGDGECHCAAYADYIRRKNAGMQVLGKPPHDSSCPVRRNASYH
jgi:hypothetical protein